jgi:hypothetical protein
MRSNHDRRVKLNPVLLEIYQRQGCELYLPLQDAELAQNLRDSRAAIFRSIELSVR